jgi:hypothetical protein
MSEYNFDNVLVALQNVQDNSTFLKVLIDIRKGVDAECPQNKANITKLRDRGLRRIISSLETPKKTIINVALSILGNCCLDANCARDVVSQVTSQAGHLLSQLYR